MSRGASALSARELKWIAAVGGTENGAATRQTAADVLQGELLRALGKNEAIVSVRNANDLPAVLQDRGFNDGAIHVEAGRVPAAGRDTNAFEYRI